MPLWHPQLAYMHQKRASQLVPLRSRLADIFRTTGKSLIFTEEQSYTDGGEMALRAAVCILNKERAEIRAGVELTGRPLEIADDDPTMAGKGTPGQRVTATLRPPRTTKAPSKQFGFAQIQADDTISEVVFKMTIMMSTAATPQAIALAITIANKLEKYGSMDDFSSCLMAAACIYFAASAVGLKMLLSKSALKGIGILDGPLRIAYNNLWLQRNIFIDEIIKQGGDLNNLPWPKNAKGEPDREMVRAGMGLEEEAPAKPRSRRRLSRCGRSSLKNVVFANYGSQPDVKMGGTEESSEEDLILQELPTDREPWELDLIAWSEGG